MVKNSGGIIKELRPDDEATELTVMVRRGEHGSQAEV